jgi:cytochrome c2
MRELRHIIMASGLLLLFYFGAYLLTNPGKGTLVAATQEEPEFFCGTVTTDIVLDKNAAHGKTLFQQNCQSCHMVNKRVCGPQIAGSMERGPWKDTDQLYGYLHHPDSFIKKNRYAAALHKEYRIMKPAFPGLSKADVGAIADYISRLPRN